MGETARQTENEQKKEFLWSYQRAKRDVARLEAQLEELHLNQLGPKAITYDGMPHGTELGDLSDYMAKYDEIEQAIIKARYWRIDAFQRVQASIEELEDDREKELLTLRYLRGMKWEEIAVKMNYSWQHTHKIHASALSHFGQEQNAIECEGNTVI